MNDDLVKSTLWSPLHTHGARKKRDPAARGPLPTNQKKTSGEEYVEGTGKQVLGNTVARETATTDAALVIKDGEGLAVRPHPLISAPQIETRLEELIGNGPRIIEIAETKIPVQQKRMSLYRPVESQRGHCPPKLHHFNQITTLARYPR